MSDIVLTESVTLSTREAAAAERFRWGPLALCSACLFVEGYDAQFMGYVVPGIASDWHIAPGALGPALGAGLFGLMLGAFFVAPLADSLGRKRVLLWSVLTFGLLIGTPGLSLLGAIAAALTIGSRRPSVLSSLVLLPLYLPPLIFGTGAVEAVLAAEGARAHLLLLGALTLAALPLAPIAAAAALRQALD